MSRTLGILGKGLTDLPLTMTELMESSNPEIAIDVLLESAKTKRGRREGDGKKISRQFATIYDIFCPVPFLPSPLDFAG